MLLFMCTKLEETPEMLLSDVKQCEIFDLIFFFLLFLLLYGCAVLLGCQISSRHFLDFTATCVSNITETALRIVHAVEWSLVQPRECS